jgi:hypothetical protein
VGLLLLSSPKIVDRFFLRKTKMDPRLREDDPPAPFDKLRASAFALKSFGATG